MSTPRLLSNRYELGETLGYGGMSEVHHGHDVRLGREVAIKILRADLARDPQFQERFRREAQNAAALNHPAIVAVYDTGEANTEFGPLPYIVMEYVEGRTLRDIVKTEGPMSQKRAMEVMADVCAALDFSHRHGIVHRDVKPANVMITKNGAVKVMDFGIARAMHDGQSAMTQTAAVIGTAQYLSPEQARGESVDARSDVYAAGCVLYELITGEPPFTGDSPVAVAYQHVREDPNPPSSVNPAVAPELDAVVLKALAKGPANRYQSAAEMRSDLVRTLSGQRPVAPMVMSEDERTQVMNADRRQPQRYDEYSEPDEDPKAKRRRRTILTAVAAVFVLGAVLLIMWLAGSFKGNDNTTVAVPDVLHQTVPQARETLKNKGFNGTIEQKQVTCTVQATGGNPECGQDDITKVIKTDPGVGVSVATNTKITLYVGVAPGKASVPDLKNKTRDQAEQALTEAKLTLDPTIGEVEVSDPNQAGLVQDQNPPPGTEASQGSSVKITVGKSKQLKTVTDFTGKPYSQAKAALEGAGWKTKKNEAASDTVPKDSVITQNPNGGQLAIGEVITLTVSTGPDQSQPTKIQMPSLAGMTVDEAQQKLQSMGWTGTLSQRADRTSGQPEGTITGQNPKAGSQINNDQQVTVSVAESLFPTTTKSSGP